tara:strand:- start:202 stop:2895 length:2694 start_codon:yes stop_codon:yes gene_type:complete
MPKIRTKKIGNIEKSGILNQNFRKTLRDEQHLSNFVLRDIFHNSNKKDKDIVQYNDNNTIFFTEKNINSTLGIENEYFNVNNKLIHTPNSFYQTNDNTFNVNRTVVSKDYHDILYENYQNELSSDRFEFFNENFVTLETISASTYDELIPKTSSFDTIAYDFKKKEYQIKKDYKEINIDFNKQFSYMSFNKNTDLSTVNRYVKFPNFGPWSTTSECCFYTGTNNTLYLDSLENSKTKFLGKVDIKSGNNIDIFKYNYITHNPLTIYPDDTVGVGAAYKLANGKSISNPISDFGFPYSNEYEGKNEVLVPASNFINEEFILEKVYIEFKLQNFAISNNQDIPCFNTLNFFILNQKEEINTNNKQYDDLYYSPTGSLLEIRYQGQPSIPGANTREKAYRTTDNREYFRSNITFDRPFGESEYSNSGLNIETEFGGQFVDRSAGEIDKNKSRELITSIKIANIGHKVYASSGVFSQTDGFDAIIQSDIANDAMTTWDGQPVYDNIVNNEFKTVKITKSVNSYNENEHLKRFSMFHVYPRQRNKRSGMDIRSERSWIENYSSVLEDTGNDSDNLRPLDKFLFPIDGGSENEINNPYVLKPKDNLIFGFNFAPSMLFNSDNISNNKYTDLTGRDVIVLDLSNLKIKLLGRYISEGKVFKPKLNEFENKNVKKINEFATNVVDKTGLPQQYALKGTYYDSYSIKDSEYPNAISSGEKSFSNMINIPTSWYQIPAGYLSINNIGFLNSFLHYDNVILQEERIIDDVFKFKNSPNSQTGDDVPNFFNKIYRFNVDHFGHFFDKENNHRHKATKNTKSGKSTFNVTKKFRVNGLYTQKTGSSTAGDPHFINSYNKDTHARMPEDPSSYVATLRTLSPDYTVRQFYDALNDDIRDGRNHPIFIDGIL